MGQFEIVTEGIYTSRVCLVGGKKVRSYELVSEIPLFAEDSLRKTRCRSIDHCFFRLPFSLPQSVRDLAKQVTLEAGTDYDRVKAVESFLKQNFRYDLNVPRTPPGRDFVDHFLFDLKRGYCTHFSTAMAVMLRAVEIPALWVKGYLAEEGEWDRWTGSYRITIRNSDAHAWVEVYFEDVGWVPFDPTPGADFDWRWERREEVPEWIWPRRKW